jgi:hypothetical protein
MSKSEKAESDFELRRAEAVSRKANKFAHPVRASIRSTYRFDIFVVIPFSFLAPKTQIRNAL